MARAADWASCSVAQVGVCGVATPPGARKALSQQNTFSKLFLVQNECTGDMRCGAAEARPAALPRPQIMATLSGLQLRWVEVLLLPEDLQARPGVGCSAATFVFARTMPHSR